MNASELIHVYVRGVIKKVVEWLNEIYTVQSMITYGTVIRRSICLTARQLRRFYQIFTLLKLLKLNCNRQC